jgi:uncharacterized membrane protein (DUF485 family)
MLSDSEFPEQRQARRLRAINRAMKVYGVVCGSLILVTFPFTLVGGGVFLLTYNQGHVRPTWAAAILAIVASAITGGVAWMAARKYDRLANERDSLRSGSLTDC